MSDQNTPKSRESRWRQWLLMGSLMLNLLIIGLVIGAWVNGGPPGDRGARLDLSLGPITRALAEDDREAVRAGLEANRPFASGQRREMRGDMQDLVATLEAETFDGDALRAVLARQRERISTVQAAAVDQLVARIELMTDEQRAGFAERLAAELNNRRPSGPPPRRN